MHNPATLSATTSALLARVDIGAFVSVSLAIVPIKDPITGNLTGNTVTIASPEHPARKDAHKKYQAAIALAAKGLPEGEPIPPEVSRALFTRMMAESFLSWDIFINGADLPFSTDAAEALLNDPARVWLSDQLFSKFNAQEVFIMVLPKK